MSVAGNIVSNHDHEDVHRGVPSPEIVAQGVPESHDHDIKKSEPSSTSGPLTNAATENKGKSSVANSKENEDAEIAKREEDVQSLARRLTSHSHVSSSGNQNPFHAPPNSALDPNGDHFNAREWTTAMLNMQLEDKDAAPTRTAGVCFEKLNVHGFGSSTDFQSSVGNVFFEGVGLVRKLMGNKGRRIDILQNLEGIVEAGEMLVVLGPPGSGCSTFLKTITGETHGFFVDETSHINYQGISPEVMHRNYRGEAIYTAEVDVHFPMMTVGETLYFAALARRPRHIPGGVSVKQWAEHQRDVIMALYGIPHTINTQVGNDFIRGVSGGERKRVTIAEASLSRATLQSWDNSTRGLDSANAIEFVKTLRMETEILGTTACVAIYQAPQAAYDYFDKALVLYEGRQIFFGSTKHAKSYFVNMGFDCPDRQTDADFLTSMTSPLERIVRPGWEDRVPRTPDEFAQRWKDSTERVELLQQIEAYNQKFPFGGEHSQKFGDSRKAQKAKGQRARSPYTLSYWQQIKLCLLRGFWRLKADPTITLTQLIANSIMALIISSVFYNLPSTTGSFFLRSSLLFFAILMNAFASALEILICYAQRPIVEKHSRYALYHPSAEAFASMLVDIPYKITNAITFNLILYFMTNLRREPGNFFFFMLISFTLTLVMSMFFRSIAALSRSLVQALAPAAILILGLVMYTGFAIPPIMILGWAKWIRYINPVSYGFESLMINEFHNRQFECNQFLPMGPGYESARGNERACSAVGSVPGQPYVDGTNYIETAYGYVPNHKWRNLGIMFVFMFGLLGVYLVATEYITAKKSKGEVLVFRRGYDAQKKSAEDIESAPTSREVSVQKDNSDDIAIIERQTAIFQWKDVCYDIKIKKEPRRILDHVDGWVKPGTLTALMGISGAGKTTLLDCLASRVTMGVISGELLVDGKSRDDSFQRKTGYAQQQDLHLSTTTVREALRFSALLRQPAHVSRQEKLDYVEEVIKLLEMTEYAEAVVGVPGEGLNVEQRKRLTIGVELAAKPALLLFLDEPTSGLDSQTSWAILDLLDRLKKNGQAILCTIHQPSAMLFQRFDRLLFLAPGGKTVYFGQIGASAETLINYFVRNGAKPCPPAANPAEWILEITGGAPGSKTDIDWYQTWRNSPEYEEVQRHLTELSSERAQMAAIQRTVSAQKREDKAAYREFAAPMVEQVRETMVRVFQQYWRTPSYIYSKIFLCVLSALFIGFSLYQTPNTQQGLQNQMFGIFMLFTIFGQLTQQMMPHFVVQRSLFEVRERPSKAYSWKAFMLAQVIVEGFYNSLMAILIYFCLYYPIGLYKNAEPTDAVALRGFQFFLFVWIFMLFTSTFTHMLIAGIESAEAAGGLGNMMFSLTLIFCGILSQNFPRFWIFMYRVSPFTYLTSALLAAGLANNRVECAQREYIHFDPPSGKTCGQYTTIYQKTFGGYIGNPNATTDCAYCTVGDTNVFLRALKSEYSTLWRNFGILFAFIIFNVVASLALYWLIRMPKSKDDTGKKMIRAEKEKGSQPRDDSSRVESQMDEHEHKEVEFGRETSLMAASTPPRQVSTPPRGEKELEEKV